MRALNLSFLAVAGAFGAVASCGGPDQPDIEPGGMPFPTGGTRPVPTATPTGGVGGRSSSSGGSSSKTTTGGRSASAGAAGCPMEEPDDNASCTLPASGSLKCAYDDTTCTCLKSAFSGRTSWDCRTTTSTGGRSSSGTGGRSSTSGGRSSGTGGAGRAGF